eukprot:429392_1
MTSKKATSSKLRRSARLNTSTEVEIHPSNEADITETVADNQASTTSKNTNNVSLRRSGRLKLKNQANEVDISEKQDDHSDYKTENVSDNQEVYKTIEITDPDGSTWMYMECTCGKDYEWHVGQEMVQCFGCDVCVPRVCHFGSYKGIKSKQVEFLCANCKQKPSLLNIQTVSKPTTATSIFDPTHPSYNRLAHNKQLIIQYNERIAAGLHQDEPPPGVTATKTIGDVEQYIYGYDEVGKLCFEMSVDKFKELFHIEKIEKYWIKKENIPTKGPAGRGRDIFKKPDFFVADIIDIVLAADPESDKFPASICVADFGLKGLTRGNKNQLARIFAGGYCQFTGCGVIETNEEKTEIINTEKRKMFDVVFEKTSILEAIEAAKKDKSCNITFYLIFGQPAMKKSCTHPALAKYPYICNNQQDVISEGDSVLVKQNEFISKLNVKMIRCGNHRNVGSSAQLHGRKKSEKQKKLGRVPGATKLHEILNLKKQKEFEENCKIFNVSKLKNMDKYNSMMYALQGIYIEPMPFSIIYINLAMMKILNKKKGDEMLIVDYTMRQMATYNMDRFSGILPPELDKYPGIRKMWGLELIGIPPARDALGGGGTTTYALVLCENGQKHNFDRCLCIMDRISGTLFNKRLKQMHNISRSDYDEALINPFVKLYGYDSIAGYIGSRWVEETLFLLSKDKEKPSYSTCHNHASARLSYRVKANIAPNTSRRKRSILIITEIEHWRNLMNRNYLSQPYAILEETILCHKRECLLGEKQLPLKDQLITIEPNDIKGMDRYRRYGEDVTESPAVEASYVGYPVDEKDAVAEEKKIDELVQEVNQNMQKYVVRMQCKKCKNFQEYVFSDEKDKILRLICETCGNALITKVSTAHDSYEYLWGVKLPDISEKHETDEDENDSELKLYVIAKTVVKRKLYTDDSGNCYQIVTVYDEEKYNLCTDIIKVDKNKLPTTFDNPFEDEKVATSFARHTNNRMPIWMKINQPMEAGRDGQAAIENSFKISKSIIPRKNEPIPEFFQKRVNFIKNQAPKIYAHIYNPNTIPQRRRNKNKNEKKTDEIEEQVVCEFDSDNENIVVQKGSTWYRGPNTSNHELTIAFKEIADIIKNQFKISQKKLVATLVDYDEGYKTFVNIGWFNSMYYDTAKYTMQTGMVLQSMKQIAQFKELPTKSSSNKSKSKKSKKSKK